MASIWESSTLGKLSQHFHHEINHGKVYGTKHEVVATSDEHLAAMGVLVEPFDDSFPLSKLGRAMKGQSRRERGFIMQGMEFTPSCLRCYMLLCFLASS